MELYEEFMLRRKHNRLQSFAEKERNKTKDVVITIPLKGGQGQRKELDEDFIKVIQNEYAIMYLESLGLAATQANIDHVLPHHPKSLTIVLHRRLRRPSAPRDLKSHERRAYRGGRLLGRNSSAGDALSCKAQPGGAS